MCTLIACKRVSAASGDIQRLENTWSVEVSLKAGLEGIRAARAGYSCFHPVGASASQMVARASSSQLLGTLPRFLPGFSFISPGWTCPRSSFPGMMIFFPSDLP